MAREPLSLDDLAVLAQTADQWEAKTPSHWWLNDPAQPTRHDLIDAISNPDRALLHSPPPVALAAYRAISWGVPLSQDFLYNTLLAVHAWYATHQPENDIVFDLRTEPGVVASRCRQTMAEWGAPDHEVGPPVPPETPAPALIIVTAAPVEETPPSPDLALFDLD